MSTDLSIYLRSGAYLPAPLRDFHDQKDVFKAMHASIRPDHESLHGVSWIMGQCYVIDIFLWWMAKRGWTLQRSRADVAFESLEQTIADQKEREDEAFKRFLEERKP